MQRLEVSGAVRPIYGSLGVKRLIPFPSVHLADLHPTSVPSTSCHFTYHFPNPVLEYTRFPPYFTIHSIHFTSLNTFLNLSLYILDFPALQNLFTSLHLSHFSPLYWKCSISSVLHNPFISLHFT